jgi:hypothetical protein
MDLHKWSESEVEYGRKILDSGLEGARSGREAFLSGRALNPFLNESVRKALIPAAIGACIGMLGSYGGNNRQKSLGRTLVFGLLGGVMGFGTGVAWESRRLTASATNGALRNIHKVRDEHWLEKHPVAYD